MMVVAHEQEKLDFYRDVAERVISKAKLLDGPVPWLRSATPGAMREHYGKNANIYVLPIDTSRVNASQLMKQSVPHDISSILGGEPVAWKNTYGLALVFGRIPVTKVALLEELIDAKRILLIGNPDSGKTTLLQHIVNRRENCIVFDPKVPDRSDKWLSATEVAGQRGDYEAIEERLQQLVGIMKDGGFGYEVTIILDEFWTLRTERQAISKLAFKLITLGRESMMNVIIGSHTERVRGLGIEGEGDLKDAFDAVVRLAYNKKTGERSATVDLGAGHVDAEHPGPFSHGKHRLSSNEIELVRLAVEENGGSFAVNKLVDLTRILYPDKCGDGGPFSEWSIRIKAEQWENEKLLTPGGGGFPRIPRTVTDELKRLAGL